MSDSSEDDLIALISKEQRGFRRILFAGLGTLMLLVAMSAALGVYYYFVAKHLTNTSDALERQAFDARVESDRQTNRVSDLERSVHRTYDEFRIVSAVSTGSLIQSQPNNAMIAVGAYLQRGDHPLKDELLIEKATRNNAGASPETLALLNGAASLLEWQRSGDQITKDTKGLPQSLAIAKNAFEKAATDPKLAPLAHTGLAWVSYIDASSTRSTYAVADCATVFAAVEASAVDSTYGPQPLYWRAQCERKLGKSREALRDYVLALRQNSETAAATNGDEAALTLGMNAYHGVGTQLVATFPVSEQELHDELTLARTLCGDAEDTGKGSARMLLARTCLNQAINLRKRLRQTVNQVSGTGENVSFSYLRDGDFEGAFANSAAVERTGLFAWNELVRALSAGHLTTATARQAEQEARRNVGYFAMGRFNPCELEVLLNTDLFQEARAIVEAEHGGESFACAATKADVQSMPPKS